MACLCPAHLARTATNIKLGAVTPLAGIMKCVLKLLLAFFLAQYLELVPMACIAGILLWVACNMIKPAEIKQVWAHGWFHFGLMLYTAVAVVVVGFLTGVVSATVIFGVVQHFMAKAIDCRSRHTRIEGGCLSGNYHRRTKRRMHMHRYRHLMVGLASPPTDAALIAYSAMVARLGTAEKVSFVHVLPNSAGVPPGSDTENCDGLCRTPRSRILPECRTSSKYPTRWWPGHLSIDC